MAKGYVAAAAVVIRAKPEKVWSALLDPDMIKRYLFGTEASSDWKVGSSITYRGEWKGQAYEDKGTILELEPERRFVSTYWSGMSGLPDSPENYATVAYELAPEGEGTRLGVSQDNNPSEEAKAQAEGNWRGVLDALKALLES